jgi:hypothetical protein
LYLPPTPARPRFEVAASIRLVFHRSAFFKTARKLARRSTRHERSDCAANHVCTHRSGLRALVFLPVLQTLLVSQPLFATKAPAVKYSATPRSQTPVKASSVPWQPNCNGAILISAGANLRQTLPPSAVKLSKKEAQKIEIRATRKFVLL